MATPEVSAVYKAGKDGRLVAHCGRARHFGWDPGQMCGSELGEMLPPTEKSDWRWKIVRERGYYRRSDGAYDLVKRSTNPHGVKVVIGRTTIICSTCQFRNVLNHPTEGA